MCVLSKPVEGLSSTALASSREQSLTAVAFLFCAQPLELNESCGSTSGWNKSYQASSTPEHFVHRLDFFEEDHAASSPPKRPQTSPRKMNVRVLPANDLLNRATVVSSTGTSTSSSSTTTTAQRLITTVATSQWFIPSMLLCSSLCYTQFLWPALAASGVGGGLTSMSMGPPGGAPPLVMNNQRPPPTFSQLEGSGGLASVIFPKFNSDTFLGRVCILQVLEYLGRSD